MGLVTKKIFPKDKKGVPTGFKAYDPARDKKQAFSLARGYPNDMPSLIVKTGEKGDVFPYTIYVKEMFRNENATNFYRKMMKKKYKE